MSSYLIKNGEADFRTFIHHWNDLELRPTPDLHQDIAKWLERQWIRKKTRLLLLAFRASGKSTLAGLFAAWLLYRNADLRILVLSGDFALARKMARQVKRILERHPLTEYLRPDAPDQWAGNQFTVKRYTELRDPSMLARGIGSNITGSRADVVICDDVETPLTCDTPDKRENLRARLAEIEYVLVPGGTQLYIGTPHTFYSIYAAEPRGETGEEVPFLQGFIRKEMPLLDAHGESAWLEKFTPYAIEQIRLRSGPNKFASQMMLRPMNILDGRLDASLLRTYGEDIEYSKELRALFLGARRIVAASAWWDPAFGAPKGDASVLAVIYTDEAGDYFLHRVEYIRNDNFSELDAATHQCRVVANIARELFLPALHVESNGIGKFLPGLLKNEIAKAKAPCAILEVNTTKPKDLRILEAFDAPLAARKIYVHAGVLKTPFLTEMQEWRPGANMQDDGLDAVAGALSHAPVRIHRIYNKGSQGWARGAKIHAAKTEFEV
jgi:hypothetical protein